MVSVIHLFSFNPPEYWAKYRDEKIENKSAILKIFLKLFGDFRLASEKFF
jgi:hypothetical protein